MRCIALGQAWQDLGGEVTFFSRELTEPIRHKLALEHMNCVASGFKVGSEADMKALKALSLRLGATAVVMDGYNFDEQYVAGIRDRCNYSSLLIDDTCELSTYRCDFVLNQNLDASLDKYGERGDKTKFLIGNEYTLIRKEFLTQPPPARKANVPVQNILVTLGGADPTHLLPRLAQWLISWGNSSQQFLILTGAANGTTASIRAIVDQDERFRVISHTNEMRAIYEWADVAICAGGSSNWEMSYFGIPRLAVVVAENQRQSVITMEAEGWILSLGDESIASESALHEKLSRLCSDTATRKRMIESGQQAIDGLGASRCAKTLLNSRKNATKRK